VKIGDPSDKRNIVLFSHHQFRSAWETGYAASAKQLAAVLPPGKRVLWLWGHEHKLNFYDVSDSYQGIPLNHYCRCVGVGGFPTSINSIPKNPRETKLVAYDRRQYTIEQGWLPIPVGFNGWLTMTFKGPSLKMDYYSLKLGPDGKVSNTTSDYLVTETWNADLKSGDITLANFTVVNPNITIVTHLFAPGDKRYRL